MSAAQAKADVFTAISDPTRRALLLRLAQEGNRNVSELLEPFSVSQPAISKHLRILREAGLVTSRKEGRLRQYTLAANRLREAYDWVGLFEKYWDHKLDALGKYLDAKKHAKAKR